MIRSQALQYEYTAPPVEGNSAILAILQRRHVPELAELDQLRRKASADGWNDEDLDGHFKTQRKVADQSNHASEAFWYEMMKKGMNEMEGAVGILPRQNTPFEFLDVCCCPGGFSSFTLVKKPAARGVGLSLPVSAGGHSFLVCTPGAPEALLELKARYVAGLRQLWSELRWGGPSGRAGRRMASTDLDFVVSTEDVLGRYLDRLIELGRGVWRAQAQGLRAFFEKKGIR